MRGPLIGLTSEVDERGFASRRLYAEAVARAGGVPVILPALEALAAAHAGAVEGVVLTGGPDVRMEQFGEATHPAARVMDARRQAYETALLRALDAAGARDVPTLGVCLGMQMMSLHRGGRLEQHLPDVLGSAASHAGDAVHAVRVEPGRWGVERGGRVTSAHHQAVRDAGSLRVVAWSEDGVIEAVEDPSRRFYVGVQWHPERTANDGDEAGGDGLADGLFRRLVERARESASRR